MDLLRTNLYLYIDLQLSIETPGTHISGSYKVLYSGYRNQSDEKCIITSIREMERQGELGSGTTSRIDEARTLM